MMHSSCGGQACGVDIVKSKCESVWNSLKLGVPLDESDLRQKLDNVRRAFRSALTSGSVGNLSSLAQGVYLGEVEKEARTMEEANSVKSSEAWSREQQCLSRLEAAAKSSSSVEDAERLVDNKWEEFKKCVRGPSAEAMNQFMKQLRQHCVDHVSRAMAEAAAARLSAEVSALRRDKAPVFVTPVASSVISRSLADLVSGRCAPCYPSPARRLSFRSDGGTPTGRATIRDGRPTFVGPRGGEYYFTDSGRKAYVRQRRR
jgi:hypothetical protein